MSLEGFERWCHERLLTGLCVTRGVVRGGLCHEKWCHERVLRGLCVMRCH